MNRELEIANEQLQMLAQKLEERDAQITQLQDQLDVSKYVERTDALLTRARAGESALREIKEYVETRLFPRLPLKKNGKRDEDDPPAYCITVIKLAEGGLAAVEGSSKLSANSAVQGDAYDMVREGSTGALVRRLETENARLLEVVKDNGLSVQYVQSLKDQNARLKWWSKMWKRLATRGWEALSHPPREARHQPGCPCLRALAISQRGRSVRGKCNCPPKDR